MKESNSKRNSGLTLVLGGTGKTGRRILQGLRAKGVPVRIGSRTAIPSFDWSREDGWDASLKDVESVYISYAPDLAMPGATASIRALTEKAKENGVRRLVLLSGRGEEEAQACERIVRESGIPWTIVRASWFNQNFSEGAFVDMVRSGTITLPVNGVSEPFVDVDDIAEVAITALTGKGHEGEIYEVTGPRSLTFDDVASELSRATGREIGFERISHEVFLDHARKSGAPEDVIWLLGYLFSTVLDGRNSGTADGVERALGRPPKDFSEYAGEAAESGIWLENRDGAS